MNLQVTLLHEAEMDLLQVYAKLFEGSEKRAERFSEGVERVLNYLAQFPEMGRPYAGRYRRRLVPGFRNLGIFYTIHGKRVVVTAIQDLRQDPKQIRRRLGL